MKMSQEFRYKEYYIYFTYFTGKCILEAFHVHADKNKMKQSSAKFFIREDGSTVVAKKGRLSDTTIRGIQRYIAANHELLYKEWINAGGTPGYYKN